jgi:4-hydroxybenzoate polyprenyltransferase
MLNLFSIKKRQAYLQLMRADKPIGTYLLLWPTLWALWIAAEGVPDLKLIIIFSLGVFLTRSAGCVINDFADRKVDGFVKRTRLRPLATGELSAKEAITLFILLMLISLVLVLFTNTFTILLSVVALLLAFCYPFMKRYTHFPQVVLGMAFGWAIPMAFSATLGYVPMEGWLLYAAKIVWTVAYDTQYAMVDRDDDLKIGIKSTAVFFGQYDRLAIAGLQLLTLCLLYWVGFSLNLGWSYTLGLVAVAGFFIYHQWLIRARAREACFTAFLNNHLAELALLVALIFEFS